MSVFRQLMLLAALVGAWAAGTQDLMAETSAPQQNEGLRVETVETGTGTNDHVMTVPWYGGDLQSSSGRYHTDMMSGAGPVAKEGELLKVHYKGAVSDGNKVVCK